MTSPYSVAKASLAQALGEAEAADIEAPRLLKAFHAGGSWPPVSSITASPIFAASWSLRLEHMGEGYGPSLYAPLGTKP